MPKIYEAKTLEEAYEAASSSLECSIIDLHIEIVQHPSNGLFGFFSKKAIIKAKAKHKKNNVKKSHSKSDIKVQTLSTKLDQLNSEDQSTQESKNMVSQKQVNSEKIFDDFYSSSAQDDIKEETIIIKDNSNNNSSIIDEIEQKVNQLFSTICYKIDRIKVDIIDDGKTVYIEFSGEDSALLIGKEGYRYKALSYILFNWINEQYGLMLRLEVAQFLANQEESINNYLTPVIETIKEDRFYKTKILDGILVHIALTRLRDEFPNMYVAVKTTINGEKYILVNEYKN